MNVRQPSSNVYYLPLPDAPPADAVVKAPGAWRRVRHAWWRLRVAAAEIRVILRPRPRYSTGDYAALLEGDGQVVGRPRAARRPGRVIDLASARLRLRPAVSP